MHKAGANDNPHRVEMLPRPAYRKRTSRFASRTSQFPRSSIGRVHFQSLPASNELQSVFADSLCDDNLGIPTQINNCED